jgi:hypothetical protein
MGLEQRISALDGGGARSPTEQARDRRTTEEAILQPSMTSGRAPSAPEISLKPRRRTAQGTMVAIQRQSVKKQMAGQNP